jgi:hypothetical protein
MDKVFVKSLVAPEIIEEVEKEEPLTAEDIINQIISLANELKRL